jgi:hypothetical protein
VSSATADQTTGRRRLMAIARTAYLLGLLAWVSYVVVLYPHWISRGYNLQPHGGFSSWHEGGADAACSGTVPPCGLHPPTVTAPRHRSAGRGNQ